MPQPACQRMPRPGPLRIGTTAASGTSLAIGAMNRPIWISPLVNGIRKISAYQRESATGSMVRRANYNMRHTFISRLAENPKVSEQTIKVLVGHSTGFAAAEARHSPRCCGIEFVVLKVRRTGNMKWRRAAQHQLRQAGDHRRANPPRTKEGEGRGAEGGYTPKERLRSDRGAEDPSDEIDEVAP